MGRCLRSLTTEAHVIRDATREDAAPIAELHVEGWQEFRTFVPAAVLSARGLLQRTADWNARLASPDPHWWTAVAEIDGRPIGFVGVEHLGEQSVFGARSEIHHLFVTAAWRRHGVGRQLLSAAADWIAERDAEPISLFSFTQNHHRAAYDRLGGRIVGERASEWDGVIIPETCYLWPSALLLKAYVAGGLSTSPGDRSRVPPIA